MVQLEGGTRHLVDKDSIRVGVIHRRAIVDDEQQARVDARHRDLRCPADEVRPEHIGDFGGLTARSSDIGRHTERSRHLRRNRRQGVVGQDDVELREVAHPLDHVRARSVVDTARVHHRHPHVVEAGLGDGDQVLGVVPPGVEDVAVGAVGEVHHLSLRVHDVAQGARRSADGEHVTGLERGASARRHRRVDVGVDGQRGRVDAGVLGVRGGGLVALARGESCEACEEEHGSADDGHGCSLSSCVMSLRFRTPWIPGRLPQDTM